MAINSRNLVFVLLAAALLFALPGCGDDGTPADGGGGGTMDTTPPGVASITAIDAFHIDVTFDEDVNRDSAERNDNYVIVERATPSPAGAAETAAIPGDTIGTGSASLKPDNRTVTITTDQMGAAPYELTVTNVADLSGNRITTPAVSGFTGMSTPDVTPPQIVYRSPQPDALGVGIGQPVTVRFSEPVIYASVVNGFSWTSTPGPVPASVASNDNVTFVMTPNAPLGNGIEYTVVFSGVCDFANNTMPVVTWSFTTTSTADTDPPTLASSTPKNGATNVNVNTNLSFTFSEPVNKNAFDALVSPDPGSGIETWSNGDRTVTFDPNLPLATNQVYTFTILPGGVRDLAGNSNDSVINVQFTTGSSFPGGSIAGTIAGDASSATAADPTGAVVIAADRNPFGDDDFGVAGSTVVGANDTYTITHLPGGAFFPVSAMDSNGDGEINPEYGDAVGAYGADLAVGDYSVDSVVVSGGGAVTGVDFALFDGSAIAGTIVYSGIYSGGGYNLYVAAFDTAGFDPQSTPDYGTSEFYPLSNPWVLNELDGNMSDGTYYVAAFLDVNFTGLYDPNTDPAGLYGGILTPTPVDVENGNDLLDIVISLFDPGPVVSPASGTAWPVTKRKHPTWRDMFANAAHREGTTTRK